MLNSPFNHQKPAILEKKIPVSFLTTNYQESLKLDVTTFFKDMSEISLYRCLETGYRFFYPYSLAGDENFYTSLQNFNWYYMPWKWEHEQCAKLIQPGMKILEIGCGRGDFLHKIQTEKGANCVGLELNLTALHQRPSKNLNLRNETVEHHAQTNQETYDIVCSFQVMEHIGENIYSFIQAQIDCLKKGGKLVISVPNNDSFLGLDPVNILNFPPHHMGLWNEASLTKLAEIFGLKLITVLYEPLQKYHKNYFSKVIAQHYFPSNKIIQKLGRRAVRALSGLFSAKLKSFSIEVIFEK